MAARLAGAPLELSELTLPALVERSPEGEAAVLAGRRLSYGELRARSTALARGLAALGVRRGDRVALLMTNRLEFPLALLAAVRAGAIAVPLNTWLSAGELEACLAHSGASLAVAEEEFRGRSFRARIEALRPRLPALRRVVAAELLEEVERRGGDGPLPAPEPGDPVLLIYTSGTTGAPKGCLHAHRSLVNNAAVNARLKRLTRDDRVIASVPFFNAFGIVNCLLESFLAGATVVVQPTFEAGETLALIERERVSILLGTPTMWIRLAEHPRLRRTDLGSLRAGTMAGAPAPSGLVERWSELGCRPVVVYGLSEAPSILADGRPTPGIEVELSDAGELRARGYNQMLGYYRDPAATAERVRDGWLRTGDLAELTQQGTIRIAGRADDLVIVGGFNVHPTEVEEALRSHPAVADAAAFGVRDRELGEVVAAWVVPRRGADAGADQLRAFCRGRLAAYKVPRLLRLVADLPLTASGKVQRFRLRELAEAELAEAARRSPPGSPPR